MARPSKYPPELRERAVRTPLESGRPVSQVTRDLSIHPEILRSWIRQAEADSGRRKDLLSSDEKSKLKEPKREVRELRKANEILKSPSVFFAKELDPDRPK